jgi:hypothetical protein
VCVCVYIYIYIIRSINKWKLFVQRGFPHKQLAIKRFQRPAKRQRPNDTRNIVWPDHNFVTQFRSIMRGATQRPSLTKRTTELRPALHNVLRGDGDGAVCACLLGRLRACSLNCIWRRFGPIWLLDVHRWVWVGRIAGMRLLGVFTGVLVSP